MRWAHWMLKPLEATGTCFMQLCEALRSCTCKEHAPDREVKLPATPPDHSTLHLRTLHIISSMIQNIPCVTTVCYCMAWHSQLGKTTDVRATCFNGGSHAGRAVKLWEKNRKAVLRNTSGPTAHVPRHGSKARKGLLGSSVSRPFFLPFYQSHMPPSAGCCKNRLCHSTT